MTTKPKRQIVLKVAFVLGVTLLVAAAAITWSRWPHSIDKGTVPSAPPALQATRRAHGRVRTPPGRIDRGQSTTVHSTRTTAGKPLTAGTYPGQMNLGLLRPVSLQIPSLGVTAPVIPVSVGQGGGLGVPANPKEVGWWAEGPPPGDPVGTAVIDGHVDWTGIGPGALFNISELSPGATITVGEQGGPMQFRVAAVREYPKVTLPWNQIFSQHVSGRLVLVTCGGSFNYETHQYHDNVVVYAVPATA